ncbi:MAG TPA: alpha/beta hydrolase [Candidatus Dormibacteraeota bacterium]|nr:alpha/beta hydrolase [Candidatus Dormibacteraeota bacterium]
MTGTAAPGGGLDGLPQMGETRRVSVGGREVRYLEVGEGAPILLVHGWIGSAENFHKWMPALEGRRKMIIPDLPGFGETPALAGEHSISTLGAFMEAFSNAIGLTLYDLGGICLGATVALELARRDPQRVRQLVLHTPIYSRRVLSRSFKIQTSIAASPPIFGAAARLARNRLVSDIYKRFVVEGPNVDQFDARVNFLNQVRATPRAAREWLADAVRQDYEAWLLGWEQPVLMVVAEDDSLLDLREMQRLTEQMQTAEVVIVPGAGHGWTDALVQAQAAAIKGFLSPQPI